MAELTEPQQRILSFLEEWFSNTSVSPCYREIMEGVGYRSVAPVQYHLDVLRGHGLVDWQDNKNRTIRLVKQPNKTEITLKVDLTTGKVKADFWFTHLDLSHELSALVEEHLAKKRRAA